MLGTGTWMLGCCWALAAELASIMAVMRLILIFTSP